MAAGTYQVNVRTQIESKEEKRREAVIVRSVFGAVTLTHAPRCQSRVDQVTKGDEERDAFRGIH